MNCQHSTSTHRPSYDNTSSSREQTNYRTSNDRPARWQSPDRHVLIIINFQDLADLSARLHPSPFNADYLDAECRVHLGAIDEVSLFTWCRHFDHREAIQIPIYAKILKLRGSDYWGDTVQLAADRTIAESLDDWVPNWRTFQPTLTSWEVLPRCPRRPFVWRLSCHRQVPGVILP